MTSICLRPAKTDHERARGFTLHYLAEGAANVVFSLREYDPLGLDSRTPFLFVGSRDVAYDPRPFVGTVLRVSKSLGKTPSGRQNMLDFETVIQPLFDTRGNGPNFLNNLMSMWMVALDPDVFPQLNDELHGHSRRFDGPIPIAKVGLLIEDMSPVMGRSVTIELKPKWLEQSPNAPFGARRCRNCALQTLRVSQGKKDEHYVCPLNVREGRPDVVEWLVERKVIEQLDHSELLPPKNTERIISAIAKYLIKGNGHALLQHLRAKQAELDPLGVLGKGEDDEAYKHNLRLAMTLRDCSLYIQCHFDSSDLRIVAKLGDLDFKSEAKMDDWKRKEEDLLNGRWYSCMEDGVDWHRRCHLSALFSRRDMERC
jgi:inositol-pentakisphosphate 2-kinase